MEREELAETIFEAMNNERWAQYRHLSFGEMAEVPALADWAHELRDAERLRRAIEGGA